MSKRFLRKVYAAAISLVMVASASLLLIVILRKGAGIPAIALFLLMASSSVLAFRAFWRKEDLLIDLERSREECELLRRDKMENVLRRCISVIQESNDGSPLVNHLLSMLGEYYDGERAYIFEVNRDRRTVSNTYEWCSEDVIPLIEENKNIRILHISGWFKALEKNGAFYVADGVTDDENQVAAVSLLAERGLSSLMAAPIVYKGEIIAFIGIDNPKAEIHDVELLANVSQFCSDAILSRNRGYEDNMVVDRISGNYIAIY